MKRQLKKLNNVILYSSISVLLYLSLFSGCSKKIIKKEMDLKNSDERISFLLKKVKEINYNSPQSFLANYTIEGVLNGKKFKSTGKAIFNKEPKRMRITFHDAIFKSPLTIIVQDREILKFYFPIEETLYMDNVNKVNLKNYSNINLDYNLISTLAIGRIPLIMDYSIKQGLTKGLNGSNKEEYIFIILENDEYFETLSFKNNVPDKILLLNKKSKEKTEVYLKKPSSKDNMFYYKTIRLISESSDFRVTIKISDIKFNIPLDLKKVIKLNLPKRCKIIYTK